MDKKNALEIILAAAYKRMDYLDELATECRSYEDNDAATEYEEESKSISWACAELNGG